MMHHYQARVHWNATDAGGVVYHAHYLMFLECARTEWMREVLGIGQREFFERDGLAFAIRSAHCEFLKPARLDDLLHIHSHIEQLGRVTITFRQEVHVLQDMIFSARLKLVCVDLVKMKSTPIPEALHLVLQKLCPSRN